MNTPILDPRDLDAIMAQVAAHARQYTPEWRYEGAEDDPGAALARLFGELFYQTVDRFNSVPGRLFTEFLELAGVEMPDPVPAEGLLQFTAHDTVEEPVPVPAGTQVFAPGEDGEDVVYETDRPIESTAAQLTALYYADTRDGVIQALDPDRPQVFFAPSGGENLHCHRFSLRQDQVLALSGPAVLEVELLGDGSHLAAETARVLADPEQAVWSYRSGGVQVPFASVRQEGERLLLEKAGPGPLEADEDGGLWVTCSGSFGGGSLLLGGARLLSRPAERTRPDSLAFGDVPLEDGRGCCFGRRPRPYGMFYLRCDQAFCKRGATVNLRLDIVPMVTEPEGEGPQYSFTQHIIDKKGAVAVQPDDVYISQVLWEYFNGMGWTPLAVTGSRNPFSCREDIPLETVFQVPEDMSPVQVNAEAGLYIRARVVHVENEFSALPRWIVPFVRDADCTWHYSQGRPAEAYRSDNDGRRAELEDPYGRGGLAFPAVTALPREPRAMYLCFDRSPHAMPLSLLFQVAGRAPLDDKLSFEAWNGVRFQPVRSIDLTRNLLHTGLVLLYLSQPLRKTAFFGREGFWLRIIRSSYLENSRGYPRVDGIRLNAVTTVQRQRSPEQWFDTGAYEAGKTLSLLAVPTLDCRVWVDELSGLAVAQAEELARAHPGQVRLEREDGVLTRCWVEWPRLDRLETAGPGDRGYVLDPYAGTVTFGDGVHGRVPPQGERSIRVTAAAGGGLRGNRPAGALTRLVGALPRISGVTNLTPMSGGTDRMSPSQLERLGNKRLRHRNRALGVSDFEEMVAEAFPQALHVKCFAGRGPSGTDAPGQVTLVVECREPEGGQAAADLCDRVYRYLEPRCSCTLTAAGGLHVIPSTVVTVNTRITVEMADLDRAAVTQQELVRRLEELINRDWRRWDIGDQVRVDQVWQAVRDTPNVRRAEQVLVEGVYDENGLSRSLPLEEDRAVPYATVRSGSHIITIC